MIDGCRTESLFREAYERGKDQLGTVVAQPLCRDRICKGDIRQ